MATKKISKKTTKNKHQIENLLTDMSSLDQPIECHFDDMAQRLMRIQKDLLLPSYIFERENIQNTITIFGSAQIKPEKEAAATLKSLKAKKVSKAVLAKAVKDYEMSKYYTAAEELAMRLQEWSNCLAVEESQRYYIMTGGGPGIMEAANKGAFKAGGKTVGATILIPDEQRRNPYVDKSVWVNFNYFLMRKFWLLFFAKALIVFPGGTGTFDEFFEVFTLMKTRKTKDYIPTILFGKEFWQKAVNFEHLIESGVINRSDLDFFKYADTVDEAYEFITEHIQEKTGLKPIG